MKDGGCRCSLLVLVLVQDAGCRMQFAGACAGCRILVQDTGAGCKILDAGARYWMLVQILVQYTGAGYS